MFTLTGKVLHIGATTENGKYKSRQLVIECGYNDYQNAYKTTNVLIDIQNNACSSLDSLNTGDMVEASVVPSANYNDKYSKYFASNKCFFIKKK